MQIETWKKYIRLYQQKQAPHTSSSTDPELLKKYAEQLKQLKAAEHRTDAFFEKQKNDARQDLHFEDIPVLLFLLSCLPMLLITQGVFELIGLEAPIVFAFGGMLGNLIVFLHSFIMLCIIHFFNLKIKDQCSIAGSVLRILLLLVCGVLAVANIVELFGTKQSWRLVYVIGGILITVIARAADWRRIRENIKEHKEGLEDIRHTNQLFRETEELYEQLEESAGKNLAEYARNNGIALPRSDTAAWFSYPRADKYGLLDKLSYTHVKTDFLKPHEDKSSFKTTEYGGEKCVSYRIRSQEFGYVQSNADEIRELFQSGKIIPFFHMGIPEFSPQLQYKIFRHKWDIDIDYYWKYTYRKTIKVDSEAQKQFDRDTALSEFLISGSLDIESDIENAPLTPENFEAKQAFEKYKKEKAEKREAIGSDYKTEIRKDSSSHTEYFYGNEIGTVLIFTPDGELVGVYCSDSYESMNFTYMTIRSRTGFEYSKYLKPNGKNQTVKIWSLV